MNKSIAVPPLGGSIWGFCPHSADIGYVLTAKEFGFTIKNPASDKGAVLSRTN